jgi:hypothetical protein
MPLRNGRKVIPAAVLVAVMAGAVIAEEGGGGTHGSVYPTANCQRVPFPMNPAFETATVSTTGTYAIHTQGYHASHVYVELFKQNQYQGNTTLQVFADPQNPMSGSYDKWTLAPFLIPVGTKGHVHKFDHHLRATFQNISKVVDKKSVPVTP